MSNSGVVRSWLDDAGWGVIDSTLTPGGCWTHFSVLAVRGHQRLAPGQAVELEWERAEQDGFRYRAVRVWPAGKEPVDAAASSGSASGAYASTLEITWDR